MVSKEWKQRSCDLLIIIVLLFLLRVPHLSLVMSGARRQAFSSLPHGSFYEGTAISAPRFQIPLFISKPRPHTRLHGSRAEEELTGGEKETKEELADKNCIHPKTLSTSARPCKSGLHTYASPSFHRSDDTCMNPLHNG